MASKTATAVATSLLRRSIPSGPIVASRPVLHWPTTTPMCSVVGSTTGRFIASATLPKLEKKIIKVPTMGDSITEGTIVEWTVEIGQAVHDGDVVAMVETDKVTLEIKAQGNGVVTQRFGAVDETVEVGAKLYEIDTDGTATLDASTLPPPVESTVAPTEPLVAAPPTLQAAESSHHRLPSIKFLGKQGWEAARKGPSAHPAPSPTVRVDDHAVALHPMYGRPRLTDAEVEALLTGGASLAPSVLLQSGGAKFK